MPFGNTASAYLELKATGASKVTSDVGKVKKSLIGLKSTVTSLGLAYLGKEIFQTSMQYERMENALKAVAGGHEGARREMAFIRSEAKRLGLDFQIVIKDYAQLAAAANKTSLAGQHVREIFSAVSEAGTVLGLSADQVSGTIYALTQMISKGIVSMEELRRQLGERLYGSFQAAARAMGLNTKELGKLVASGKLMTDEFLPKLAKELKKTYGSGLDEATNSAVANLNRFKNAIFDAKMKIARSGFMSSVVSVMMWLTNTAIPTLLRVFDEMVFSIRKISLVITNIFQKMKNSIKDTIADVLDYFADLDSKYRKEFGFDDKSLQGVRDFANEVRNSKQPVDDLTEAMKALAIERAKALGMLEGPVVQPPVAQPTQPTGAEGPEVPRGVESQLGNLEMLGMTDEERLLETYQRRMEIINKAHADEYINDVRQKQLLLSVAKKYEDDLEKLEREKRGQKLGATKTLFDGIAAIASLGGKKLFKIQKIAGIASAIIDTYTAINKTMASVPYPFNLVAAAGVAAKGFANVAAIKSQTYGGGGSSSSGGFSGASSSGISEPQTIATNYSQAPVINITFNGSSIVSQDQLYEFGEQFADTLEKLQSDGKLAFNG